MHLDCGLLADSRAKPSFVVLPIGFAHFQNLWRWAYLPAVEPPLPARWKISEQSKWVLENSD